MDQTESRTICLNSGVGDDVTQTYRHVEHDRTHQPHSKDYREDNKQGLDLLIWEPDLPKNNLSEDGDYQKSAGGEENLHRRQGHELLVRAFLDREAPHVHCTQRAKDGSGFDELLERQESPEQALRCKVW